MTALDNVDKEFRNAIGSVVQQSAVNGRATQSCAWIDVTKYSKKDRGTDKLKTRSNRATCNVKGMADNEV